MSNESSSSTPSLQRHLSTFLHNPPVQPDSKSDPIAHWHRKTKITCTLGPSSGNVEQISALLRAGMNIARLNFSHGTHKSHLVTLNNVREAIRQTGIVCAIMLDTKGPEIRTGLLKNGKPIKLKAGQQLTILTDQNMETFEGDEQTICLDYLNLPSVVKEGSIIKIDDGLIVCTVLNTTTTSVVVRVENSAELGQKKGVNLPGTPVDLPPVTEQDKRDLIFGAENGFDFIAASFTRNGACVDTIREILGEKGKSIQIICKIESQEGLDNFDEILAHADGIMVARGDLGVEIPIQKVCLAQKMIIRKCNIAGKPVITATQMLESMVTNPRPTRAEATDVANAVFDGTDCVMLSGETAKGEYPVAAVEIMAKICCSSEMALDYPALFHSMVHFTKKPINRAEAITSSAVKSSMDLDAAAIIVLTESGSSARFVSKYKPSAPIMMLTPNEQNARQALISRNIWPLVVKRDTNERLTLKAMAFAREKGWCKDGDSMVLVAGMVQGVSGSTNTLMIVDV